MPYFVTCRFDSLSCSRLSQDIFCQLISCQLTGSFASLRLCNRLVRVMRLAVGEEPVDDDATDGEDEDEQAPEELLERWAVRFEDLNCGRCVSLRVVGGG